MFENKWYSLTTDETGLVYTAGGVAKRLAHPAFELDGHVCDVRCAFTEKSQRTLHNGGTEHVLTGQWQGMTVTLTVRTADTPVVRFKYALSDCGKTKFTRTAGTERLRFTSYEADGALTEVRFSDWNQTLHCFTMREAEAFRHESTVMGPMLVETGNGIASLCAYEHGSTYPDRFVQFRRDGKRVDIEAVKGSYCDGESAEGYETLWLEYAAVAGGLDELSAEYRRFILLYISEYNESRKPYIYYNTWAYEERSKYLKGAYYYDPLNPVRMLEEVEAAHRMGVDVFVIDAGWFDKSGDWTVDVNRFPDGLKAVSEKVRSYGMKFGLWFDPRVANAFGKTFEEYKRCKSDYNGKVYDPFTTCESPGNYIMCLVSDYWKVFADRLIGLSRELGVTYFKWDAVWQYDCDGEGHHHGGAHNPYPDRRQRYAYRLPEYMGKMADRIHEACPEAIIDFDITEAHRSVGLSFLAHGKYFLVNNGPYYKNIDVKLPLPIWDNVYVNPGPARPWIGRTPLTYDKWIPSVLLLTHYLPDDPHDSQLINLASMLLGQNGVWGDLPGVSEEGKALFYEVLTEYKKVAADVTAARLVTTGTPGDPFEVREKIDSATGRGLVSLFGLLPSKYTYRTAAPVAQSVYTMGGAEVRYEDGHAVISVTFGENPSAAIVLFK